MVSIVGRSAATLLAVSTRRSFFLSSSAVAFSAAIPTLSSSAASTSKLCAASSSDAMSGTGYLNAQDAAALDAELMSSPGFSLEQLMELAGLSVAEAVYDVSMDGGDAGKKKRALLVCGPGNNGGDGLVAARHLVHFGLDATVVYPKRSGKTHFVNLVKQCEDMNIPILDEVPMSSAEGGYDVIVDAIFGFSFHGTAPREPYATAIASMVELQRRDKSLLVSVDVPSGWDVDGGDLTGTGFRPDVLVSLTAPKLSAKKYEGRHFVGGRFLPPAIAEKYNIRMPPYPGLRHSMEVSSEKETNTMEVAKEEVDDEEDWAVEYQRYLEEQEREQTRTKDLAEDKSEDLDSGVKKNGRNNATEEGSDDEDWAVQYQEYLEEKERNDREQAKVMDSERDGGEEEEEEEDTEDDEEEDWALQYAKYCEEKEREFFESIRTNKE